MAHSFQKVEDQVWVFRFQADWRDSFGPLTIKPPSINKEEASLFKDTFQNPPLWSANTSTDQEH